jgi:hypothetical protein
MIVVAVYRQGANLEAEVRLTAMAGRASTANWIVLPLAAALLVLILLLRWRELYRWMPRRQGGAVSALESWLLLYTPSRRSVLLLHVLFHGLFLLLYGLLNLWSIFAGSWLVPYVVVCCFIVTFVMFGICYWARRLSA